MVPQKLRRPYRTDPLEYAIVKGEPLPPPSRPHQRSELYDVFCAMEVGQMVEVNRGDDAIRALLYRYKKIYGLLYDYAVRRSTKPGHSRIWRVA